MTWTEVGDLPCPDELERDPPCQGELEMDLPCQGDLERVHRDLPCQDSCLDERGWGLPCLGDPDLARVPCLDSDLPCPGESLVPWEYCQDVRMAPLVLGRPEEFQDWIHDEDCLNPVQSG